jgi:hypothetical protein
MKIGRFVKEKMHALHFSGGICPSFLALSSAGHKCRNFSNIERRGAHSFFFGKFYPLINSPQCREKLLKRTERTA